MNRIALALLLSLAVEAPAAPALVAPFRAGGASLQWTTTPLSVSPSATDGLAIVDAAGNGSTAWTQLTASTAGPWTLYAMAIDSPAESFVYVEVGVGAAASETVVARIQCGSPNATSSGVCYFGPLAAVVPTGSRVSIRFTDFYSLSSGLTWRFKLMYYEGAMTGNVSPVTAGTWDAMYTNPTCGASWANSAWVEGMSAAANTTDRYIIGITHQDNAGIGGYQWEGDIGTGAAGSETVVFTQASQGNWSANGGSMWTDSVLPIKKIPSGVRIALRCRVSTSAKSVWFSAHYVTAVTGMQTGIFTTGVQKVAPTAAGATTVQSANTIGGVWQYGSWVQFIASTANPIAVTGIYRADDTTSLEAVATGAGGAETLVTEQPVFDRGASGQNSAAWWPLYPAYGAIPASTRVSMAHSDATNVNTTQFKLGYIENNDAFMVTERQRQFPDRTAPSVTPSGSNWGNSSWVELASAATVTTDVLITQVAAYPPSATNGRGYEIDIGTGAGGAETAVMTVAGVSGTGNHTHVLRAAHKIVAGTRLSFRLRKESTDTTAWRVVIAYLRDDPPGTLTGLANWPNPIKFCCAPADLWRWFLTEGTRVASR